VAAARRDAHGTARVADRVARIEDEIQDDLGHLHGVGEDGRQGLVESLVERHELGKRRSREFEGVLHERIEVDGLGPPLGEAREGVDPRAERGAARGGVLDPLEEGEDRVRALEAATHELGVSHDAGQEVVHVVRDAAGDLAQVLELARLLRQDHALREFRAVGRALDRDSGEARRRLEHVLLELTRDRRAPLRDGEGPGEGVAMDRDRHRPAGADPEARGLLAHVRPMWIGHRVDDEHALPQGRDRRTRTVTDAGAHALEPAPHGGGDPGARRQAEVLAPLIEEHHRRERAGDELVDQAAELVERAIAVHAERHPSEDRALDRQQPIALLRREHGRAAARAFDLDLTVVRHRCPSCSAPNPR
jgi:hypothetical protein